MHMGRGAPRSGPIRTQQRGRDLKKSTASRSSSISERNTSSTPPSPSRKAPSPRSRPKDEAGAVRGIFASARDITEQSRLQARLAEERAYNRGLIESSVDGLVTVDAAVALM